MQFMSYKGASGRLWLLLQIHVPSSRSRVLEITRVFSISAIIQAAIPWGGKRKMIEETRVIYFVLMLTKGPVIIGRNN